MAKLVYLTLLSVAPFVGAWIEIAIYDTDAELYASLRSSERGLKFYTILNLFNLLSVAPFVGEWIEIRGRKHFRKH